MVHRVFLIFDTGILPRDPTTVSLLQNTRDHNFMQKGGGGGGEALLYAQALFKRHAFVSHQLTATDDEPFNSINRGIQTSVINNRGIQTADINNIPYSSTASIHETHPKKRPRKS